jgi:tetratricopeptide (TPR) repeat protein
MSEKTLNQIPAAQRELYDKGMAALRRNNLDYAVTLFTQALRNEPGFYDCREALRATQHKRMGAKAGFFRKFVGSANTLTKGQLALRSNPHEALNIAEEVLNENPASVPAHQLLAEAALASNLPKTAVLSLEVAFKHNPQDRKLAENLADTLLAVGQKARAERILRDLVRAHPGDPVLNEKLKNAMASRTLSEGGYETLGEGTGSYRDIIRDKQEAVSLEQEGRAVKDVDVATRLIAEYEARVPQEAGNLRLLRQIAELSAEKKDFDKAAEYYERILKVGGVNDPVILSALRETRLAKFDQQLKELDPTAANHNARVAEVQGAKTAFMIEDARRRADMNPTDLMVRFELGELHFQAGRIGEAIAELQKAQNNPHKRIAAMSLLAQCFARRGMNDLAARKLQEAIKEKPVFDDEMKDLRYTLGEVYEKMGKAELAIEEFKSIYEQDIAYRDVMAKVDAYYAAKP